MQLSVFEIAWFSHLKGELTDDYFYSWVTNMAEVAQRPAFSAMWLNDRTKIMHAGFRQYMNTFMERTATSGTSVASRSVGRNDDKAKPILSGTGRGDDGGFCLSRPDRPSGPASRGLACRLEFFDPAVNQDLALCQFQRTRPPDRMLPRA